VRRPREVSFPLAQRRNAFWSTYGLAVLLGWWLWGFATFAVFVLTGVPRGIALFSLGQTLLTGLWVIGWIVHIRHRQFAAAELRRMADAPLAETEEPSGE
jgi:hypothetical protein